MTHCRFSFHGKVFLSLFTSHLTGGFRWRSCPCWSRRSRFRTQGPRLLVEHALGFGLQTLRFLLTCLPQWCLLPCQFWPPELNFFNRSNRMPGGFLFCHSWVVSRSPAMIFPLVSKTHIIAMSQICYNMYNVNYHNLQNRNRNVKTKQVEFLYSLPSSSISSKNFRSRRRREK